MVKLITTGVPSIVCILAFECLPNHVVGKGAIKQLNRIKLMLSTAGKALEKESADAN